MADEENTAERAKPVLPGNKGQFGEDAATERFEPLRTPAGPAPERPAPTGMDEPG